MALAASLATPEGAPNLPERPQRAMLRLGDATGGLKTQMQIRITSTEHVNINPEAFNFQRVRDIADDSKKLLKLAIALKAEIDSSSSGELSAAALAKARQIEKLAKDVKSRMRLNPVLERP